MQSHQTIVRPEISHAVILGDSLSDSGTLKQRKILGIIPMGLLAGLGQSPDGRFTNGYAWSDHFCAMLEEEFLIDKTEQKHATHTYKRDIDAADLADDILTRSTRPQAPSHKPLLDSTDIADEVIADRRFDRKLNKFYTLDNNLFVPYEGRDFIRSYDEGGLTSHDYSHEFTFNITEEFSRKLLANLPQKRELMLQHDEQLEIPLSQKKESLIIEWSGANDLVTVNSEPTNKEADLSIQARLENVEKLIHHGYQHFVLFNMPDLSLTPRFQKLEGASGEKARANGKAVVEYLNASLQTKVQALQEKYKASGCTIEVYDVNKTFSAVYEDTLNRAPSEHKYPGNFEKDKLKIPFTESKDFVDKNGISSAPGYMFWNDVHPSATMHEILANDFYKHTQQRYHFSKPKPYTAAMLCEAFIKKHNKLSRSDGQGRLAFFKDNALQLDDCNTHPEAAVVTILQYALEKNDARAKQAIQELKWIDDKGKINEALPALKTAKMMMEAEAHLKHTSIGLTS